MSIKDFQLLVSLGVFNSALMNDAVYKFKRYEDASLSYTGVNKHGDQEIGLYDTVLSPKDYQSQRATRLIQVFHSLLHPHQGRSETTVFSQYGWTLALSLTPLRSPPRLRLKRSVRSFPLNESELIAPETLFN